MNDGSLLEKVVGHMEENLTGNELEMLYAAADYRRAEIVMNQYFDKVPGNVWKYVR
ncbi:TPA: transcriptional regulator [Klebsiella pneumoniae]|nr:transcriptional regulator [Klebsiella pneumoniae]PZA58741.1 transcriptional regulator [Klebsiella pneumoniae subsp. pneumoniae]HCB3047119.1 transcriptional regulator [Klebsiella aerogenes]HCR0068456.1 transcriptional regulator [Enterobacter hormaechei]EKW1563653.1 transcriptional regulator [Klebsiella pneumoniae]